MVDTNKALSSLHGIYIYMKLQSYVVIYCIHEMQKYYVWYYFVYMKCKNSICDGILYIWNGKILWMLMYTWIEKILCIILHCVYEMKNYYMWYIVYMKWKIIIHDNVSYSWNEKNITYDNISYRWIEKILYIILYCVYEIKKCYMLYIVYIKCKNIICDGILYMWNEKILYIILYYILYMKCKNIIRDNISYIWNEKYYTW